MSDGQWALVNVAVGVVVLAALGFTLWWWEPVRAMRRLQRRR